MWSQADSFHSFVSAPHCPPFSAINPYTCMCCCCIPSCTAVDTPQNSFGPICVVCTVTGHTSIALHQIAWRCTRVHDVMIHHIALHDAPSDQACCSGDLSCSPISYPYPSSWIPYLPYAMQQNGVGVNVSTCEDGMAFVMDSHPAFAVANIDILPVWHLCKHSQVQAVNKQLSHVFNSKKAEWCIACGRYGLQSDKH